MDELKIVPCSSELGLDKLLKSVSNIEDAQVFDADSIVSKKHLEVAFFHARQAFAENMNIANSLKMEFLLRAAATRQIKVALEKCGVKNPTRIILATWGEEKDVAKILSILNAKKKKLKVNESHLVSLHNLDRKRNLEKQIIEKMVEVQIGD
ncbi:MAG: KEOPS complex subunit Cgi121 [Candidatus Micrarchaeia archaeon]